MADRYGVSILAHVLCVVSSFATTRTSTAMLLQCTLFERGGDHSIAALLFLANHGRQPLLLPLPSHRFGGRILCRSSRKVAQILIVVVYHFRQTFASASPATMSTDCPVCLNEMSRADLMVPLHCPTATCDFNVCLSCIKNMLKSEADGYTEASDGSRQVKFRVKCPSCRAKYVTEKHPKHSCVSYVVIIRSACEMLPLLEESDSALSAHNLQRKHEFISTTTRGEIQDAVVNLKNYWTDIEKTGDLDLDLSKFDILPESLKSTRRQHTTPWRDASLFQGLEELMTVSEQEFLTQLFCSGNPDSLAQGAHILHGMLFSTADRQAVKAVQDLCTFGPAERKEVTQWRTRFPLPVHMPRCVQLPVFDPTSNNPSLRFNKRTDDLVLAQVRGPAGRSGLRRGDVVTHLHSEPIETRDAYVQLVKQSFDEDPQGVLIVVVNANEETAQALKERMITMRKTLKK